MLIDQLLQKPPWICVCIYIYIYIEKKNNFSWQGAEWFLVMAFPQWCSCTHSRHSLLSGATELVSNIEGITIEFDLEVAILLNSTTQNWHDQHGISSKEVHAYTVGDEEILHVYSQTWTSANLRSLSPKKYPKTILGLQVSAYAHA